MINAQDPQYRGPERRRSNAPYNGPERRKLDWPFKPLSRNRQDGIAPTTTPGRRDVTE